MSLGEALTASEGEKCSIIIVSDKFKFFSLNEGMYSFTLNYC